MHKCKNDWCFNNGNNHKSGENDKVCKNHLNSKTIQNGNNSKSAQLV